MRTPGKDGKTGFFQLTSNSMHNIVEKLLGELTELPLLEVISFTPTHFAPPTLIIIHLPDQCIIIPSDANDYYYLCRYKADPEKKWPLTTTCTYNALTNARRTVMLKGGDMKRTSRETVLLTGRNTRTIKASKRSRYWNDPAVRLAKCASERTRYRRGHRTTTTAHMLWHVVLKSCACNICTA